MALRHGHLARFMLVCGAIVALLCAGTVAALAAPSAAIVTDARTGQVLYEHNADARLHPASLTKMLTLYIAFDAIRRGEIGLDTLVTVSAKAAAEPPSRLGLRAGQRISMRHLIRAAALKSGNDAATAIGEAISGSEAAFARRMNRTAAALGMTRSTFKNAHGLTADGHLSSARDMNLLGRRLFFDFPQYYALFSRRSEDAGIARVRNTNSRFLDSYSGADGIKTGYTRAAGFNLTASAERGNKRIIATVYGGTSTAQRNARMMQLMDIGFGKAPARATTKPPQSVALDSVAKASQQAVIAAAGQSGSQAGARAGAAKTIRVSYTMQTSPRPKRRPDPVAPDTEAIAAIQGEVADVLAQIAEAPELAQVDAVDLTATRPVARSESVPFEIVTGLPESDAPIAPEQPQAQMAEADAAVPTSRPPPRPVQAELAAADAVQASTEPVPVELAEAVEVPLPLEAKALDAILDAIEEDLPLPRDEAEEQIPEIATFAALPALAPPPVLGVVEQVALARPQLRPGEIVMTAASAGPEEPPPPAVGGEVVTRISTSGGRLWAANIGRYPNRGSAERALLQIALSETRALDGALRKVVQRNGQWEATFAGLTRDQADLACRRLNARAQPCFMLGP